MVGADRFEVPQGGIGGVVLRHVAAVGEAVRQHALVEIPGEGGQDATGHLEPSGRQRETGQRDHGVASPVAEPRVAGDHRPTLGTVGERAADDELIGRVNQLLDGLRPLAQPRLLQQLRRASQLRRMGALAVQFRRFLRAEDDGDALPGQQPASEVRDDQFVLDAVEAALVLDRQILTQPPPAGGTQVRTDAEYLQRYPAGDDGSPQAVLYRRNDGRYTYRRPADVMVVAEASCHLTGDHDRRVRPHQGVAQVGGVLAVRHEDALLQQRLRGLQRPDRQAMLQPEAQPFRGRSELDPAGPLPGLPGQPVLALRHAHGVGDATGQHPPSHRRLQGSDQHPVVAPRPRAVHGAHRVATDSVADQPLPLNRLSAVIDLGDHQLCHRPALRDLPRCYPGSACCRAGNRPRECEARRQAFVFNDGKRERSGWTVQHRRPAIVRRPPRL